MRLVEYQQLVEGEKKRKDFYHWENDRVVVGLWLLHAALAFAIALIYCLLHHYHYAACHVIYNFKDVWETSKYLLQGFFEAINKFFPFHICCRCFFVWSKLLAKWKRLKSPLKRYCYCCCCYQSSLTHSGWLISPSTECPFTTSLITFIKANPFVNLIFLTANTRRVSCPAKYGFIRPVSEMSDDRIVAAMSKHERHEEYLKSSGQSWSALAIESNNNYFACHIN